MADHHDITAAKGTYDSFIGTLKWSVPALAALAALVVVLIS
jgi:Bacterial aa3 type cytochrome c oxidase subunit IV